MKVHVKVLPGLSAQLTPGPQLSREGPVCVAEGSTLRDLLLGGELAGHALDFLLEEGGASLRADVQLTINERLVAPIRALDVVLHDGDHVTLFPVYAGG